VGQQRWERKVSLEGEIIKKESNSNLSRNVFHRLVKFENQ
jgi:hypothetical protein